jgi:hypothetical protein
MNEPRFPRFPVRVSPDGKTAEIQCWFVDGKNKLFTGEELLQQIHKINPGVDLSQVIFTPGISCFYITVPCR